MSLTIIEREFTAALATVIDSACTANGIFPTWPIRWPNEGWSNLPTGITESPENVPVDLLGNPVPFVEAEVIGGPSNPSIAPEGMRQTETIGVFRVYLVVPQREGRVGINLLADATHDGFNRKTIFIDPPLRLYTLNPRVDPLPEHSTQTEARIDGAVPAPWKGARYVRMVSVVWYYDFLG